MAGGEAQRIKLATERRLGPDYTLINFGGDQGPLVEASLRPVFR
jgi:hypothetical protein